MKIELEEFILRIFNKLKLDGVEYVDDEKFNEVIECVKGSGIKEFLSKEDFETDSSEKNDNIINNYYFSIYYNILFNINKFYYNYKEEYGFQFDNKELKIKFPSEEKREEFENMKRSQLLVDEKIYLYSGYETFVTNDDELFKKIFAGMSNLFELTVKRYTGNINKFERGLISKGPNNYFNYIVKNFIDFSYINKNILLFQIIIFKYTIKILKNMKDKGEKKDKELFIRKVEQHIQKLYIFLKKYFKAEKNQLFSKKLDAIGCIESEKKAGEIIKKTNNKNTIESIEDI